MAACSGIDWPAWTQAVGSIVAILVASGVPVWQRYKENEDKMEEKRRKTRAYAISFIPTVSSIYNDMTKISETIDRITNMSGQVKAQDFSFIQRFIENGNFKDFRNFVLNIEYMDAETANIVATAYSRAADLAHLHDKIAREDPGIITTRDPTTGKLINQGRIYIPRGEIDPAPVIEILGRLLDHLRAMRDVPTAETLSEKRLSRPMR